MARFSLPLALLIAITNAIVVREGLTVLVRFGEIPPFGQVDVTLEALAYGAAARRCASSSSCCRSRSSRRRSTPTSCCAAMRRLSFRSALTAALATRMIPVLTRDARRMEHARRCRPDGDDAPRRRRAWPSSAPSPSGALDRAVDVAATLELRGFANARRAPHEPGPPWSRHDVSVAASAAGAVRCCCVCGTRERRRDASTRIRPSS